MPDTNDHITFDTTLDPNDSYEIEFSLTKPVLSPRGAEHAEATAYLVGKQTGSRLLTRERIDILSGSDKDAFVHRACKHVDAYLTPVINPRSAEAKQYAHDLLAKAHGEALVKFASARSETLTAGQLALIGRSLLLRGESVWHVGRGRRLAPASSVTVQGGLFPESWTYRLNMAGPASTRTVSATAGTVLHVRIGTTPERPWSGCSPLTNSVATRDALAYVERSLMQEHAGPVGSIIAVQDPESSGEVASAIGNAKGDVLLGDSAATGLAGDAQKNDWNPHRFGPAPSQGTVLTRDSLERAIWAGAGVPVELLRPSSGVDQREGWRRFLFSVVAPLGAILSAELRRLGLASELDWTELRASDLASRSRSYKQLTEAGVAPARAEQLCGFD